MHNLLQRFEWKSFKEEVFEYFVNGNVDIAYSFLENAKVIKSRLRLTWGSNKLTENI